MLRQLQRLKAKLVMSRQTKAPTTAGVDVPRPVKKPVDSRWCGLRDASLSGWFNHETGELLDGFEVGASDVLLDLGCGEGGLTMFCAKQGPHVVISDIEADIYLMADGDGTYDASAAPRLIEKLLTDRLDMVVGTRKDGCAAIHDTLCC